MMMTVAPAICVLSGCTTYDTAKDPAFQATLAHLRQQTKDHAKWASHATNAELDADIAYNEHEILVQKLDSINDTLDQIARDAEGY
jgi:hypothetical protein